MKKRYSAILILAALLNCGAALAHAPHDVVTAVELSPEYAKDKTVYTIVRGKFLKSVDGGKAWKRLVNGLDSPFSLGSLTVLPQDKSKIYVSTFGDGIYQSSDCGASWEKANEGLDDLNIGLVKAFPQGLIFAAGEKGGLYKKADAERRWKKVLNDKEVSAMARLDNGGIIAGAKDGSLFISYDLGDTWSGFNKPGKGGAITSLAGLKDEVFVGSENGLFKTNMSGKILVRIDNGITDNFIRDICVIRNEIYISTANAGVFKSVDSGRTWRIQSNGLTRTIQAEEDSYSSHHFGRLASSGDTLFLGGFNGLFKSENGAGSWKETESLSSKIPLGIAISPDYAKDSTIAVATYTDGGYVSESAGKSWRSLNNGLYVPMYKGKERPGYIETGWTLTPPRFYDIKFSPAYTKDSTIFWTMLRDSGLFKSTDGGKTWKKITTQSGWERGFTIAVSPDFLSDGTIFMASQMGNIYRSADRGEKFKLIRNFGDFNNNPFPLVISPDFKNDRAIFAAGRKNGLYSSRDKGDSWICLTDNADFRDKTISHIAVSPDYADDRMLIVAAANAIYKSSDAGEDWEEIKLPVDNPGIEALAISPDYRNDKTFLISFKGKGLYRTGDGGQSFRNIGNNAISFSLYAPAASPTIQFSPDYASDRTIYGFGAAGPEIYRSTDGGESWDTVKIPENDSLLVGIKNYLNLAKSRLLNRGHLPKEDGKGHDAE